MAIIPDNKDWTWVLTQSCPECGFDAAVATPATVATAIPALLPRWQQALRSQDVLERPTESRWSVLEYSAHVRDVFDVFAARLQLMLDNDEPTFADWDQDIAALDGNYETLEPAEVSAELLQAGLDAAAAFASVPPEQWERSGLRSDGSKFTILSLSGYFLHDVIHHLHDVDA